MRYVVIGADRDTGAEKAATIDASGKAEADKKAAELGWLISAVRPDANWRPPPPDDVLDYSGGPVKHVLPMPITSEGTAPPADPSMPPDYPELKNGASTVRGVGALCSVGGVLVIVFGVLGAINSHDANSAIAALIGGFAGGFLLIGVGSVLGLLSAMATAHRDMARNSYSSPMTLKSVES